nr:hypothetical protein BaRGS_007032 [Batillaria attramentaria]
MLANDSRKALARRIGISSLSGQSLVMLLVQPANPVSQPCSTFQRREIMAQAPTGSGKTAAFVIPILHHLREPRNLGFRALILAPTRELAKQILQVCRQLSEGIGFRCRYIEKATTAANKFGPKSKQNFDLLVTTPNRLVFLLKHDPPLINLSRVEWLVVDESDKLFESGFMGFRDQLAVIYNACSSNNICRALFSATFAHDVEEWCKLTLDNVVQVTVGARNAAAHLVKQELLFVGNESGKRLALRDLIRKGIEPPVLIFVQSKDRAKELFSEFIYDGINVDVIHADRTQLQRDNTVRSFVEGKIWVLICTELMGRGIDFKGINLVINYDFPTTAVSYIHRIGLACGAGCWLPESVSNLAPLPPQDLLGQWQEKKQKIPVKRKRIATVLYEDEPGKKRRKLSADTPKPNAGDSTYKQKKKEGARKTVTKRKQKKKKMPQ